MNTTELSCAVAEKILGWSFWNEKRGEYTLCVPVTKKDGGPWNKRFGEEADQLRYTRVSAAEAAAIGFFGTEPPFARNIETAWTIVEMLSISIHTCAPGTDGKPAGYWAGIPTDGKPSMVGDVDGECVAYGKTAPIAICLAALKIKAAKEKESR